MKEYQIYLPNEINFLVDENKKDYDKSEYTLKYDSTIDTEGKTDGQVLEVIFEKFNLAKPHDYHGHSLSTGDIVVLDGQAYICETFGWGKINLA